MKRVFIVLLFILISMIQYGQIIADHAAVDKYDFIPQYYIDEVKKMLLIVAGESHSNGYFEGLISVEELDPTYQVNWSSSGAPVAATDSYLRVSKGTWGDYDNETGWIHSYGEEDWFTNATALTRTKAGISYCHANGLTISAIGFGWCYDQISGPNTTAADPEYGVHWAGRSEHGPEGSLAWGIDADDYAETGNSISMDTYISATQEYIDYCAANGIPTKVFFTTGPVDDYSTEDHYQGYLKHEHLREYVRADPSRILFDYADILCFDDDGSGTTDNWEGHTFPAITPTNMTPVSAGHISEAGAERLGKAMWWMLARIAGWNPSGSDDTPPSVPSGMSLESVSEISVTIAWNASSDDVGVSGYRVFRSGTLLGTTSALFYTDNTVDACSSYTYTVLAFDKAENESEQSPGLDANTNIPSPEGVITQPNCTISTGAIDITSPIGTGIEYMLDASNSWVSGTSFTGLTAGNTYISVRNTIADANCVSSSSFIINTVPSPPATPSVSDAAPVNICPAETVDITSLVTSTTPTGGYILYKTTDDPLGTDLSDPAAAEAGTYYLFYQNQECYSTAREVTVVINPCSISSIPTKVSSAGELSIFPNPSDGQFMIDIGEESGSYSLEITSSSGVTVVRKLIHLSGSPSPVNLEAFEAGIYYIRLFDSERIYNSKLFIVK